MENCSGSSDTSMTVNQQWVLLRLQRTNDLNNLLGLTGIGWVLIADRNMDVCDIHICQERSCYLTLREKRLFCQRQNRTYSLLVQRADVFGIEWNATGCELFWLNPRDLHIPYACSADTSSV